MLCLLLLALPTHSLAPARPRTLNRTRTRTKPPSPGPRAALARLPLRVLLLTLGRLQTPWGRVQGPQGLAALLSLRRRPGGGL